jgi:hypothetical protein
MLTALIVDDMFLVTDLYEVSKITVSLMVLWLMIGSHKDQPSAFDQQILSITSSG